MKKFTTAVFCFMLVLSMARADTYTWDGGGSDANWSTADNWGGTAPVADNALFFGGISGLINTNDLTADTSFAGITFSNGAEAFTLSGNRLTLGDDLVNLDADTQTINLDMILSATRTLNASNGIVTINGELSGPGGLNKTGSQPLILTGSNSYDGATLVYPSSVLRVQSSYALGSTNSNTIVEDGGWIELSGGINVPESIALYGDKSTSYQGTLRNKGGSNVISGVILNGSRLKCTSGSLDLIGGVQGGQFVLGADSGTFIRIAEKPIRIGGSTFYAHTSSTIIIAVTNNTWGTMEISGSDIRTDVDNAMASTCQLKFGGSSYCGLNLNGHNQTIDRLYCDRTTAGTRHVYSDTPATLILKQNASTLYIGTIDGVANLVKAGTGTITFSNRISETTGDIIVSNGTLVVASSAAFSASTNIIATGSGTLELRTSTALADSAALFIDSGAQIRLAAGLTETVDRLFVNGEQQESGTYGATGSGAVFIDDVHFDGSGILFVTSSPPITPVSYTWDDGGEDTLFSTTNNWVGDVLPEFDGTTAAVFGTGGNTATVDIAADLYGITLNRDDNFTLAADDGVISNGVGGITAQAPTTSSRTYTLATDVELTDNQTWCITNNTAGTTTLEASGSINDGFVPYRITKTGNGGLTLTSSSTFDGDLMVENGLLRVRHNQALGSTNGTTTIKGVAGAKLYLYDGINLAEPLVLNGEKANGSTVDNISGNNTLSGPITCLSQVRLRITSGTLVVSGGITEADGIVNLFVVNSSTVITFKEKPLKLGVKQFYADSGGLTILDVAGNTWADTLVASGTLRCDVPNALPPAASLRMGISYGPNSTLDLNGNNQTASRLYMGTTNPGNRVIVSATPAQLTVNQGANTVVDAKFTGAVSLLKTGSGNLTLTNALNDTTGSFAVSNGTLTVGNQGTFGSNSTNIMVLGTGTLALQNSTAISDTATLSITDEEAQINLATGVNETVGYLFINDVNMPVGTYGVTGSGADVIDDVHFAGTGILTITRNRDPGTIIILR